MVCKNMLQLLPSKIKFWENQPNLQ